MYSIKPLKVIGILMLVTIVITIICYYAGLRINTDRSMSAIFWRLSSQPIKRNSYVLICLPRWFVTQHSLDRHFPRGGRCGGILPLIKQVIAHENDQISINANGVSVNSMYIQHSKPLPHVVRHHNQQTIVPQNRFVVVGQTFDSLDSRYFGLVHKEWIESSITPLF